MRRHLWIVSALLLLGIWLAAGGWPGADQPAPIPPQAEVPAPLPSPGTAPRQDGAEATTTQRPASAPDAAQWLPPQALATLRRIHAGGPHPHRQDGSIFHNRERLLPAQPRGWYREYTVDTPGLSHRGARRIVTGGDPPHEYWYTDDHYRSFVAFDPPPETLQ